MDGRTNSLTVFSRRESCYSDLMPLSTTSRPDTNTCGKMDGNDDSYKRLFASIRKLLTNKLISSTCSL